MNKKHIICIILLALSIILSVLSFCFLPKTVITQFSNNDSGVTTMPKIVAILLPFALNAGGAVYSLMNKDEKNKGMFISVVGVVLFAIMLVVNLA